MFRFYQFVGKDTYNYPYRLELEESFGIINDISCRYRQKVVYLQPK